MLADVPEGGNYDVELRLVRESDGAVLGSDLYHEVRYEQLVHDREQTIADLCAFMGLEYADAMVNFHEGRKRSGVSRHVTEFFGLEGPPQHGSGHGVPRGAYAGIRLRAQSRHCTRLRAQHDLHMLAVHLELDSIPIRW